MSAFEDNLREEIRKLERKYNDQVQINERISSVSRCSSPCNKSDVVRMKALMLSCMELLEDSIPRSVAIRDEWLARRCAFRAEVEKL